MTSRNKTFIPSGDICELILAKSRCFPTKRCWDLAILTYYSRSLVLVHKYKVKPLRELNYEQNHKLQPEKRLIGQDLFLNNRR